MGFELVFFLSIVLIRQQRQYYFIHNEKDEILIFSSAVAMVSRMLLIIEAGITSQFSTTKAGNYGFTQCKSAIVSIATNDRLCSIQGMKNISSEQVPDFSMRKDLQSKQVK